MTIGFKEALLKTRAESWYGCKQSHYRSQTVFRRVFNLDRGKEWMPLPQVAQGISRLDLGLNHLASCWGSTGSGKSDRSLTCLAEASSRKQRALWQIVIHIQCWENRRKVTAMTILRKRYESFGALELVWGHRKNKAFLDILSSVSKAYYFKSSKIQ